NSNLVSSTNPKSLTVVGNAYKTAAQAMPQTINLLAVHTAPGPQAQAGGLTTITVLVGVMDNGSIAPSGGTNVTVYADPARTQVLGTGILSGARGCARRETTALVEWTVPSTLHGRIPYYVTVDPGNALGETTMADNNIDGSV